MALPLPRHWTYEDYCAIPDDGRRYEVIGGKLYVAPSPIVPHQRLVGLLFRVLCTYVEAHRLGEVFIAPLDVLLAYDTVVQPDLFFVRVERSHIVTRGNVAGAPDLVVEILSPGTARRDRREKLDAYALFGVPHYWILDAERRTLEAFELHEGGYVLVYQGRGDDVFAPTLFPGLTIPLAALWR
ncbi:MAG: Uma2 family endonuclease [Chloroflexi bacterium]|nr:Uma2 family endonuclease [Chloroflexota bacterium]